MATTIGSFDLASLKNLRDDVTQYFWFESDSSSAWGSGAHVTLYPESQFTNSTSPNYMKGQNIIMNTDGFSIRNGALPMMVLDNDSLDFNAIDTGLDTYTTMATFGLTGATIGQTSGSHSVIDTNGQRFYASDGTTQLANIGYGEGINISGGTSTAPYYSLGSRTTATQQYNPSGTYEVGEVCLYDGKTYVCTTNIDTPEAWTQSHWKYSIGNYSFSGGYSTIAAGYSSTAEGCVTRAIGGFSHAEGYNTIALGDYSHAAGVSTITNPNRNAQTVIGQYNIQDTSVPDILQRGGLLLIIGNGIGIQGADNERSNALTVDWDGNVKCAGYIIASGHTNPIGWYDTHNNTSSISSGTTYQSISASAISLAPGRYMLFGSARFSGASSGYRGITIFEGNDTIGRAAASQPCIPSSSWTTALNTSCFVAVSSTTTYKLGVYQNSGSSLSTTWDFYAVAIR